MRVPWIIFLVLALAPAQAVGVDASDDASAQQDAQADATPVPPPRTATPLDEIPADRRPEIRARVRGADEVMLGQTLTLEITVERRAEDRIHLPVDTSFGAFDLVEKKLATKPAQKGRVTDVYAMDLLALTPGEVTIPALTFGGVLEGGEVVRLVTDPITVQVKDPTAGVEDDEPRDIAPVVDVYQQDYTLLWVLGSILVLILVALLVRFMVKNWDRWHPRGPLAPPPPRPPEVVAFEKLDGLREAGLPESGAKKGWYIDLSEIMREYIGNRYGFDGLESTTEEIVRVMRGKKTAGLTQAELFSFLNDCDMVKFARYEPGSEEDEEALDEAYRIVKVTTPNLVAPAAREGGEP